MTITCGKWLGTLSLPQQLRAVGTALRTALPPPGNCPQAEGDEHTYLRRYLVRPVHLYMSIRARSIIRRYRRVVADLRGIPLNRANPSHITCAYLLRQEDDTCTLFLQAEVRHLRLHRGRGRGGALARFGEQTKPASGALGALARANAGGLGREGRLVGRAGGGGDEIVRSGDNIPMCAEVLAEHGVVWLADLASLRDMSLHSRRNSENHLQ